ncbi:hypothetical protein CLOM_g13216 [Closterium sp. NIES-68]|nr:hypothetical protein CLOM_g13216 [Closterium sp. NIES-68]GJP73249.1 hypothetical protein CLOP_g3992 [Closterium sp. NIES-67]GJP81449.1 hypothetical protein CLOP_g11598 [Closterium sp. NIES-67]
MGWMAAVAIGAITPGLNRPTLVLVNLVLAGLFLSFAALLPAALRYSRDPSSSAAAASAASRGSAASGSGGSSEMLHHVLFLLALTLLLIAALNWLAWEVGTVSPHSQARALLSPPTEDGAQQGAPTAREASSKAKKKHRANKQRSKGRR